VLEGRSIQTRVPSDLPLVRLDAVLVERVFANLFENASKYTPPGSPIAIAATIEEQGEHRYVKLEVRDDGPGLPAGMESRVFEKFTRGEKESAKPGIGLGLAICRAIVEAHGGSIGASTRRAADGSVRGAAFWFTLPADETPPNTPPIELSPIDPTASVTSSLEEAPLETPPHIPSEGRAENR
jgi:two-component system sensor histidine kinase KdpD